MCVRVCLCNKMTSIYDEIPYASMTESPQSFAYLPLAGIARKVYNKVRPSSDFPELPQPSTDLKVLQKDFMKYGYCLVKDALSKEEIEIAKARLLDQAEAECHSVQAPAFNIWEYGD